MDVWNWFQDLIERSKKYGAKRQYFYLVDWFDYYAEGWWPEEVISMARLEPEWEFVCGAS